MTGRDDGAEAPEPGGPALVRVLLRRLEPTTEVPASARPGDAGVDLRASHDLRLAARGGRGVVGTGLAVAIPWGCCGLVLPRSGLARDHGVTCLNAPGLVDAGYRGELQVLLVNTDPEAAFDVRQGRAHRPARGRGVRGAGVRRRRRRCPPSERGEGGWGHSGRA